jgi:hypothetical protein
VIDNATLVSINKTLMAENAAARTLAYGQEGNAE